MQIISVKTKDNLVPFAGIEHINTLKAKGKLPQAWFYYWRLIPSHVVQLLNYYFYALST
jgi:hypothetical protein